MRGLWLQHIMWIRALDRKHRRPYGCGHSREKAFAREHLHLTEEVAIRRYAGQYAAEIAAYETLEHQILSIADMMTGGMIRQFGL